MLIQIPAPSNFVEGIMMHKCHEAYKESVYPNIGNLPKQFRAITHKNMWDIIELSRYRDVLKSSLTFR